MVFVACGLNHKTTPIHMREKVALPVAAQDKLLASLAGLPAVNEAVILSTCNRTEIYCDTEDTAPLSSWLAEEHQLNPEELSPYLYIHQGHEGVRHTLRVASGLDSMMVGEPQIFGQMKQAYLQAVRVGTIKTNLRQVFQYVFNASKRIRTHSGIGNSPVSIAYAAVQLIGQSFTDYKPLRVFIIGSGETATLVAKYLNKAGVSDFTIASRTEEHAKALSSTLMGKTVGIGDIPHHLSMADVVISATSCPLPFINQSLVQHAQENRQNQPIFFLDLAVPRDIEANVKDIEGVTLYNVDDLQHIISQGLSHRQHAAIEAERLIESELDSYIRWHRSLNAKNIICNYRNKMQNLADLELSRAKLRLNKGNSPEEVLEELTARLVNKIAHNPTIGLRNAAWDNRQEVIDLAQYLFDTLPI